jgi:hypothetical protein
MNNEQLVISNLQLKVKYYVYVEFIHSAMVFIAKENPEAIRESAARHCERSEAIQTGGASCRIVPLRSQ